jgi:cbb3-type cytochrome oxidase subunit 1
MHWRNRAFVTLSLLYALLGGLVGITWLLDPALIPGNIARLHGHIMLLGFVGMMIYGVGLHVLPRFSGFPLYSERLANWQFYVANAGLVLMIAGWLVAINPVVLAGGAVSWLAMGFFALNIMLTVKARGPAG